MANSGAASADDAFRLVIKRGDFIAKGRRGGKKRHGGVLALPVETVEALCAKFQKVYPVNYNCPGQLTVAGSAEEMPLFKEEVNAAGGKFIPLPVSGGFHSPFMETAAKSFGEELKNYTIGAPRIPFYSNTRRVYGENPAGLLVSQIKSPDRWQKLVENMLAAGPTPLSRWGRARLCRASSRKLPQSPPAACGGFRDLQATVKR